ncbi:MAG: transglutaminase family protein [Desulfobacteraceae bacterium]|nr:transglutaminase family protein [Desulfobacteraceae bacterium]
MSHFRCLFIFFILFFLLPFSVEAKNDFLAATPYIDSDHPAIVERAKKVTAGAKTDREKAVKIHDFVRDKIPFGFTSKFYNQKASDVLKSGMGYCNTKATLLIALMRAQRIPAKHHFVNINALILEGVIDPGTPFVDHSFAQVLIDGQWIKIDSYVLDLKLAKQAQARLAAEKKAYGFGAHINGISQWDGKTDAFCQFVNDGAVKDLTTADHGVFDDIGAFYASENAINKLNFIVRILFRFISKSTNKKIDAIRNNK